MGAPYSLSFTAEPQHIDELGHVNNAVWVQWIQTMATSHWAAVADPAHVAAYAWMVTRHEIDYRGNIAVDDVATGRTWIEKGPRGARFDRHVEFTDANGKTLVRAVSTWAMFDKASGRLMRVSAEVAAPFM